MKVHNYFALNILFLFVLSGCFRLPITITVLDEESKEPIEGAVAIAWYSRSYGLPGLTYSKTKEVAERISDEKGEFTLPFFSCGCTPRIRIYKPGYIGWNNYRIYNGILFNDYKRPKIIKRQDFVYKSQEVFLERWEENYTRTSHYSFLFRAPFPNDHEDIDCVKSIYSSTIRKYELPLEREEKKRKNQ